MSRTTEPGYVNRNNQMVVCDTGRTGTDHGQRVYKLRCETVARNTVQTTLTSSSGVARTAIREAPARTCCDQSGLTGISVRSWH